MKLRLIILILATLTIFLLNRKSKTSPSTPQNSTSNSSNSHPNPPPSPEIDTTNTDPRFTRFLDGRIHWQAALETSRKLHQSPDPSADLSLIDKLLSHYRLVYQENPVGTENFEIIAFLLGNNPKKVTFIAPDSPALNQDGELLDRWGSPYIFHPLSADRMDIRSLGPDRKLWTDDDLSLGLEKNEAQLQLKE